MTGKFVVLRHRIVKILRNHQIFVTLVVILAVIIAVVVRIGMLNSINTDQSVVDNETSSLKPVKFNQAAIDEMRELRDSNVTIPGTELPGNRQNPFSE